MDTQVDEARLHELVGKVIGDVAGSMAVFLAYLGDQAGVYRALAAAPGQTVEALAGRSGINPKYLHEWLGANAAAGYVTYDAENERFSLSPEQELVFATEGHPACLQGFFQGVVSQYETNRDALETFVSGDGRAWGDHSQCLFCGTDRFFRPGYAASLLSAWIPALDGVHDKLDAGASVVDIGCGHGSSTLLMAEAYPRSRFTGVDFHPPSVEEARARAAKSGFDNVDFVVARAQDYPGNDYDFACIFDALHDMGDPVGAARHIRETLKADGTLMLVEPLAGDTMAENMNPIGQIFYAFSTTVCTPASLAQEGAMGLGAQAGERRLTRVLNEGGFGSVRRAAETETNMVLEVRA